ncbi:MAG: hypothetical protein HYS81_01700 [Candidatus Aenigmatarchaeota archaeon]|nr:MAG: hypothetical protein HYS81_01700 [Candidatus Aenigmarchaeota archaeon]
MKNVLLALLAVVLVAGCVNFGGSLAAFTLFPTKTTSTVEDLRIDVQAAPDEVLEGKKMTLFFTLTNAGNTTINDVTLTVTDTCAFDPVTATSTVKTFETIAPDEIKTHDVELKAQAVDTERLCALRYATSYRSTATLQTDIAVVSEDELIRLNRKGEESNIEITEVQSLGPVLIDLRFSKPQPIPENTQFFMYTKLVNSGSGDVTEIATRGFTIDYPKDLITLETSEGSVCDDLDPLTLPGVSTFIGQFATYKPLKFIDKETKTITCKLRTGPVGSSVTRVGTFHATASYKYTLRGETTATINPE